MGEVKAVNIFEHLFAIDIPTYNFFVCFSSKRGCRIVSVKELSRKSSEGSQSVSMSMLIHSMSENFVPYGIVFIDSVSSRTC